jgi:membrane fusion protein (multidrug efflux system)
MSNGEAKYESREVAAEATQLSRETEGPARKSKRKQIVILASVAIAVILLGSWVLVRSFSNKSKTQEAKAASDKATQTPTVMVAYVVSQEVNKELRLPGELHAYQNVAIYPKVQGFVESINVDRGSVVKRGQLLIRMSAPELASHTSEAEARVSAARQQRLEMESRVQSVREQRAEAAAKLAVDEGTYRRLKAAAATPGVVAENDVDIARGAVEADKARIRLIEQNEKAAQSVVQSQKENEKATRDAANSVRDIESYLRITAPFDGVVTERNVDRGSLVGPSSGPASTPMLRLQQITRLRLIVPVPESDVAGVVAGSRVNFTVPAFPGENFGGVLQRVSHMLDEKTRTMPVELDVINDSGRLAPGMFPEVMWPTHRPKPSLFVPASAIATTTERSFVIRIRNGVTEWVNVKRGVSMGDLVEIFGELEENDLVAVRGTDELRAGTLVATRQAQPAPSPR